MTECYEMTPESRAALSTVCSGTCGSGTARDCNSKCDECLYETFTGDQYSSPECVEDCWTCIPYYHCTGGDPSSPPPYPPPSPPTAGDDDPCFPGEAMLMTPQGPKSARELKAYDTVLARSVDGGSFGYEKVSPLSIAWRDAIPRFLFHKRDRRHVPSRHGSAPPEHGGGVLRQPDVRQRRISRRRDPRKNE